MVSENFLKAPAKLNLLLRITGKRADGFHELVTLFHPVVRIADEIRFDLNAPAPGITMTCSHPDVPSDSSNLIVKAASAFAQKMGLSPAWHLELVKNIPTAAGMGGGSSDAGTVLRFLAEVFPGCSSGDLNTLAASIGADVPFFLSPCDAAGRGIGEKLSPLNIPSCPLILAVFPNFPVRAVWAYRNLKKITPPGQAEEELTELVEALKAGDPVKAASLCANDLEDALFAKFPLLCHLRRTLLDLGALCVHVSGSGPTLFAMFGTSEELRQAARKLGTPENTGAGIRIMEC